MMYRKACLFERQLSNSSTDSVPEFSGSMDTLKSYYSRLHQYPEGPYGRRGSASSEVSPYVEPEWECIGDNKEYFAPGRGMPSGSQCGQPAKNQIEAQQETAFVSRPSVTPIASPVMAVNSPRLKRFKPMGTAAADDRMQRPY
jgi:hypothetical protein